jgi:hypothetical protein
MARICTESAIPVQQQGLPFPLATGREAQEHMEHPEGSVVFQYACNMFVSKRVGQVQESEAPAVKREAEEDWRR